MGAAPETAGSSCSLFICDQLCICIPRSAPGIALTYPHTAPTFIIAVNQRINPQFVLTLSQLQADNSCFHVKRRDGKSVLLL